MARRASLGASAPYIIQGTGIYIPLIGKTMDLRDFYGGMTMEYDEKQKISIRLKKEADEEGDAAKKAAVDALSKAKAPTVEEWLVILFFKDYINGLLQECGGEPLHEAWYWTSDTGKYLESNRWAVNVYSRYVGPVDDHKHGKCRFRLLR